MSALNSIVDNKLGPINKWLNNPIVYKPIKPNNDPINVYLQDNNFPYGYKRAKIDAPPKIDEVNYDCKLINLLVKQME